MLLKVNTNSGDRFPYSTSPEMIRHLGGRLRDKGASVIVGDRSFWGDPHTDKNLEENGIAGAARSVSARVLCFEGEKVEWIQIPSEKVPHWRGPVRVPRLVVQCDQVMNLPCVKTHFITTYTMALKNLLGLVHPEDRARPGNLRTHTQERIYNQVADIHRFVRCDWHVLDGYRALISGGPTPSSGAKSKIAVPGIVAVSQDAIAIDAFGIGLLRSLCPSSERVTMFKTWDNPMIRAAIKAKIGIKSPKQMNVIGATGKQLSRVCELATS